MIVNLIRPFLAACVMGVAVWLSWRGLSTLGLTGLTGRVVLAGVSVAIGFVVYVLAAIALKVVTREDCLLLPKGEKIAKLLKL